MSVWKCYYRQWTTHTKEGWQCSLCRFRGHSREREERRRLFVQKKGTGTGGTLAGAEGLGAYFVFLTLYRGKRIGAISTLQDISVHSTYNVHENFIMTYSLISPGFQGCMLRYPCYRQFDVCIVRNGISNLSILYYYVCILPFDQKLPI